MTEFDELWPRTLPPRIISACVGGGLTTNIIHHVYHLIRAAMILHRIAETAEADLESPSERTTPLDPSKGDAK